MDEARTASGHSSWADDTAYPSQHWLTFKQALEAGGNVRKGEKGAMVVYADRFVPEAEKTKARETGEDAKAVPFLKRFTVFNVAQCEGLREGLVQQQAAAADPRNSSPCRRADRSNGCGLPRRRGSEAFYSPGGDFVAGPPQPAFREQINFYRTAFHELSHWTGHAKRLGRDQSGRFGLKPYAREELCAEISAAYRTPMSIHQSQLITEWGPTTLYLNGAELSGDEAA